MTPSNKPLADIHLARCPFWPWRVPLLLPDRFKQRALLTSPRAAPRGASSLVISPLTGAQ